LAEVVTIEGAFTSSNPTCPVLSHALLQGADDFDMTPYTGEGATFHISMQTDDNEQIDGYVYEVQATAEGGRTASIQGTADINIVCVADLVTSFEKAYSVDLPDINAGPNNDGVETYTLPFVSADYVTAPPTDSAYLPDGVVCS
jgi:hypothetical protein